jgi:hypothetical protein
LGPSRLATGYKASGDRSPADAGPAIAADIRDVFAEAKGNGFDVKAIRQIVKLRKMDTAEREEAETVLDTYMRARGMQPDLFDEPGGEAA